MADKAVVSLDQANANLPRLDKDMGAIGPAGETIYAPLIATTATLAAGTALIGKVGIDQATANANEVVVKSGTVTAVTAITNALPAGTNLVGKVSIDQATASANEVVVKSITAGTNLIGKMSIDQATANANEVVVKSITAGTNLIGKFSIDQATANANEVVVKAASATPLNYRTAVTAADVLAAVGTVTCTKINSVGALTAGTYYVKVVAVNAHGRGVGKAGDTTVTTESTNLCIKAAFAAVTGATHYDIYCTTAADPLWVGRITEAQRASGIIIDAVGSTTAGGAVDSVYIYAIGTGLASGATAAVNTAYVVPASPVVATGKKYVDFGIYASTTGDAATPVLIVVPAIYNSRTTLYEMCENESVIIGGAAGLYGSKIQRIRVETRGEEAVALLVQSIAGTGMSVNMDYVLS